MGMRRLPGSAALLWLSFSALACTTAASSHGAGSGGSSAGTGAGAASGNPALPGAGAAAADSGGSPPDSTVPNGPDGGSMTLMDAAADATAPGPIDAAEPRDALMEAAPQPAGCPLELPLFDEPCYRENLACMYGMECCPDWAYCEFGRWTLLTHHCDACP